MSYKTRQIISSLLGVVSAVGTVVTTVLAVKETPKALKKLDELKNTYKDKKIPFKVWIKEFMPIYWPSIVVGAATIASPIAATIMSRRTEASLIATSTMLSQGWNKYKYKVKELIGPKGEKLIRANVAQDDFDKKKPQPTKGSKQLYYEEHLGWFYADPVELQAGLEDINQRLYTPDAKSNDGPTYWATLYWFAQDSKANVLDKDKLAACQDMGWTVEYISEMYVKRFVWVHPSFTRVFDKETGVLLYTMLTFEEEPIYLNMYALEREYHSYKKTGQYDYMHEAESDVNFQDDGSYDDRAALDLEFHGNQQQVDAICADADERRGPVYARQEVYFKEYDDPMMADQIFSPSSPSNKDHLINAYSDGSVVGAKTDRIEYDLPDIKELESLPLGDK